MQLGFLTSGVVPDIKFAARAGFECLELCLFGDTPLFEDHHDFKQALADYGVNLAAVSLFGQNYFHPSGAQRAQIEERLKRVTELAVALGSPILVTGSGTPPMGEAETQMQSVAAQLRDPIQSAQRQGLKFAFYNCQWENVVDRPSAWERAMPQMPDVGIKFDPSHPIQGERDWKIELLAAGPHLMHVHAKDVLKVGGMYLPDPNPGLGEMRWEEFFGILYHVGYDAAVCIEPHSDLYTGDRRYQFLKLGGGYLRRFLVDRRER
jgi:sugar phosphate isomerase/epimerase